MKTPVVAWRLKTKKQAGAPTTTDWHPWLSHFIPSGRRLEAGKREQGSAMEMKVGQYAVAASCCSAKFGRGSG